MKHTTVSVLGKVLKYELQKAFLQASGSAEG